MSNEKLELKEGVAKQKMIFDIKRDIKFEHYFEVPVKDFMDSVCTMIANAMMIDIIQFSQFLQQYHGYVVSEHGTIDDFVATRFGEEALEIVQELQ